MSKTGPLGKAESFYVEEKFKSGKSVEEIASDLDRSNVSIQKHVETLNIKPDNIFSNQFIRQAGSTIMTENASSMIDSKKKTSSPLNPSCTTKLK
jgi:hypothetical protein